MSQLPFDFTIIGGFTSPLARGCLRISALGFLSALGFVPECHKLLGFSGFFGFFGLAYIVEIVVTLRRGAPLSRRGH